MKFQFRFNVRSYMLLIIFLLFAQIVFVPKAYSGPLGLHKVLLEEHYVTKEIVWGWAVAHKRYDIELPAEGIVRVSILCILSRGVHEDIESRAADTAERLTIAWHLMNRGAKLVVNEDSRPELFLVPPSKELKYNKLPAIYVISNELKIPFRVLTVFPEDKDRYARGYQKGITSLAEFLKAQIQAHFLLFWKHSSEIFEYELLALDKTREGKIYKEIFLRINEYMNSLAAVTMEPRHIKDSLARIEVDQRHRLHMLSSRIPIDWKFFR